MRKVYLVTLIFWISFLGACGKGNNGSATPPPPPPPVKATVSPTSATVPIGKTQQFTSNVDANWYVNDVQSGNSTVGTIDISGLYTPPQLPPNPATVKVKNCSRTDATNCAIATVTIVAGPGSFTALKFWAPQNGTASGETASTTATGILVAGADAVLQGAADPQAAFITYGADGNKLGEWVNTWPSSLSASFYDTVSGNVFAVGYAGTSSDPSGRSAMILGLLPSDPTHVVLEKTFQFDRNGNVVGDGSGLRTEAVAISVMGGKLYLAVRSDYQLCGLAFNACSGDWVVTADLAGNVLNMFAVGNIPAERFADRTEITGLLVLADHMWVTGNWFTLGGDGSWYVSGFYMEKWTPNGQLSINGATVFSGWFNARPVEELVNGNVIVSETFFSGSKTYFGIMGLASDIQNVTTSRTWDGDNAATSFTNLNNGSFINNGTDIVVVGSLSGLINNQVSNGGAISWASDGNGASGGAVLWKQRFDSLPLGIVSSWNSGSKSDAGGIALVGTGTDGNNACGSANCGTAVIGRWLLP
ncbi:MAG: hypothetical protein KGJ89_00645 [Patescibacteria group bacterium]|nr:hypothetical protein [Patescibacteria group bacterium]MDE2015022.1 hypothetical protein [Patescibacteria group bacterium]MDE2226450.1 hypothetical protein [Patescibacteria group bacterium]